MNSWFTDLINSMRENNQLSERRTKISLVTDLHCIHKVDSMECVVAGPLLLQCESSVQGRKKKNTTPSPALWRRERGGGGGGVGETERLLFVSAFFSCFCVLRFAFTAASLFYFLGLGLFVFFALRFLCVLCFLRSTLGNLLAMHGIGSEDFGTRL